nr:hypothetical protein [Tanacetum cinerariifolium]
MATTTAQQIALDNALVALEKQVKIGKYNMRIDHEMTTKEPTYQVVLDTLALTTCYPAFLITASVPMIYMQQTYLAFAIEATTPKPKRLYNKTASPIIKTPTTSPEETHSKKKTTPAKKDVSSKKASRKQSTVVQIRDTPGMSVSKKKAPVTTDKSKGIEMLSEVLDVHKDQYESENESWGDSGEDGDSNDDDSDDDGNDDASDDEGTESDDDQNDDDKDEEYEEEYVHTPENYESTNDEDKHVDEEEYDHFDKKLHKYVNVRHEEPSTHIPSLLSIPVMIIPENSTAIAATIPPPIPPITLIQQLSTPTTEATKTSIPDLANFSFVFQFNQRVSNLEKELSKLKQADQYAQLLASIKS